jgi:hypothetical protein
MTEKRNYTNLPGQVRGISALSPKSVMPVRRGETITGQRVILDEVRLEGCILVDCDIIYRGGETSDDFTTKGCTWHLEGAAWRTLAFMRAFHFLGITRDEHLGKGK